eukprot:1147546-Pelagomonas_calceolata.AAC.4
MLMTAQSNSASLRVLAPCTVPSSLQLVQLPKALPHPHATEYAAALHNVLSRSMAGVADSGALVTLLVCYMGLALAAVYISRTELRLPTMQYASVAAASQVRMPIL